MTAYSSPVDRTGLQVLVGWRGGRGVCACVGWKERSVCVCEGGRGGGVYAWFEGRGMCACVGAEGVCAWGGVGDECGVRERKGVSWLL